MNIGFSPISQKVSYTSKAQQPKKEVDTATKKANTDYYTGFLSGALFASMIAGGMHFENAATSKHMLQDLEIEYTDKNKQNFVIEDVNNDKYPEIIVENENGEKIVYDFANEKSSIIYENDTTEIEY